jgi:hypothetical protein
MGSVGRARIEKVKIETETAGSSKSRKTEQGNGRSVDAAGRLIYILQEYSAMK